jgi:hypothetical protein
MIQDAKSYLKQVKKIDLKISNKLVEQQQWRDIALSVTSGGESVKLINAKGKAELHNVEKVQSSGGQDKMADAIAKCVDMGAEINSLIDELTAIKKDVVKTIELLDNPTEYDLLHKRYIQYIPLKTIATLYGTEYTNITTIHGRALKNVQILLDAKKYIKV